MDRNTNNRLPIIVYIYYKTDKLLICLIFFILHASLMVELKKLQDLDCNILMVVRYKDANIVF